MFVYEGGAFRLEETADSVDFIQFESHRSGEHNKRLQYPFQNGKLKKVKLGKREKGANFMNFLFGTVMGIAATIIAGMKGRVLYALGIGMWTAIAFIFLLLSGYGLAPGWLFLIIAICMKKETSDENTNAGETPAGTEVSTAQLPLDARKFICENCGALSTGWYEKCPNCGADGRMRKATEAERIKRLPETEQPHEEAEIRFCHKCGHQLGGGSRFCSNCGVSVAVPETDG